MKSVFPKIEVEDSLSKSNQGELMRKELLLDNTSSLHQRLVEYRRQVKSKTFDSDSDEEDQE